jgi:hypothetical protein
MAFCRRFPLRKKARSMSNLAPINSRPMRASQEPGVSGVSRAKSPIMIRMMAMIFLMIFFIEAGYRFPFLIQRLVLVLLPAC